MITSNLQNDQKYLKNDFTLVETLLDESFMYCKVFSSFLPYRLLFTCFQLNHPNLWLGQSLGANSWSCFNRISESGELGQHVNRRNKSTQSY